MYRKRRMMAAPRENARILLLMSAECEDVNDEYETVGMMRTAAVIVIKEHRTFVAFLLNLIVSLPYVEATTQMPRT
jgi:hypothetical protein